MPLPRLYLQHLSYTAKHYLWHGEDGEDDFLLDPPYQRESVWSDTQRVNLIQSLMMGVPVGAVVLNDRSRAEGYRYAVVDGRQRIETVRMWFTDRFSVPADWWEPDELGTPAGQLEVDGDGVRTGALLATVPCGPVAVQHHLEAAGVRDEVAGCGGTAGLPAGQLRRGRADQRRPGPGRASHGAAGRGVLTGERCTRTADGQTATRHLGT